jgi:hypothetical protein
MSAPLGCYQLVGLQHRQNCVPVVQVEMVRASDGWTAFQFGLIANGMHAL